MKFYLCLWLFRLSVKTEGNGKCDKTLNQKVSSVLRRRILYHIHLSKCVGVYVLSSNLNLSNMFIYQNISSAIKLAVWIKAKLLP